MSNVLVFVEQRDGSFRRSSMEALTVGATLAAELGGSLHAVTAGSGISESAADLGAYGVARVFVADDPALERYNQSAYAEAVSRSLKSVEATCVLFAASAMGKDLAPAVAARHESCAAVDCTAIRAEEGRITITRPVFAGKVFQTCVFERTPAFVSLRPNVFADTETSPGAKADVETLDVDVSGLRAVVKEILREESERPDLTEAAIVVSGGRGLKSPENFGIIEDLASSLGAAVGASRAVVDAGWRPHGEQVGQTGKTVSPNLYVAVAISGAIQHLAGMRSSKVIVAVNKDPEAPIFKVADYGIVGDAFEVVPAMIEEIRKRGQ